ncbi:MAG: FeoB small GTPase domain-containing protein [Syntrophothermus sp.]
MGNWRRFFEPGVGGWRNRYRHGRSCHNAGLSVNARGLKKIVLVGSPNVGKSVIFNRLTGAYVTVSNYPGTTVEVSRGKARIGAEEFEVVDTPGLYSLLPITEEERVTRRLLLEEKPDVVVHVIDAKNIARMLPLTIQLAEAGLPLILDINIMDEAEKLGMRIDVAKLESLLGIPVVPTVSTTGRGIGDLQRRIAGHVSTAVAS